MSAKSPDRLVTLGRISGVYGVRGWVKVHSYTEPRDNVVGFACWTIRSAGGEERFRVDTGRVEYWMGQGAQQSERVADLLKQNKGAAAAA